MDYSQYEVSDFVADEYFVLWVLSPDEENDAFWDRWMKTFPERRKTIHEARLMVLLMDSRQLQLEKGSKQRIWNAIRTEAFEAHISTEDTSVPIPGARTARRLYSWSKLAALLLVFAGFSYLILLIVQDPVSEQIVVENSRGEKSTIYLPDGTKVWLNAESKISYPSHFNQSDERLVHLTGEAFFDVTENPIKPFVVRTSDLQIRVLGTAFNVRSFMDDKTVETTLLRGAVTIELNDAKMKSRGEPIVLRENQQAIYSSDSKELSLSDVEAENVASWTEGRLVLVNKPVSEIRKELERWYGVEIRMEDGGNADCRFSTTIDNEPITRILDLFSTTGDITYTITDNIITIKGHLCP